MTRGIQFVVYLLWFSKAIKMIIFFRLAIRYGTPYRDCEFIAPTKKIVTTKSKPRFFIFIPVLHKVFSDMYSMPNGLIIQFHFYNPYHQLKIFFPAAGADGACSPEFKEERMPFTCKSFNTAGALSISSTSCIILSMSCLNKRFSSI